MNFLRKRENIKESLALVSLFVALEVILTTLVALFPYSILILFFILSFPSFIISLCVKGKYYLLYFILSLSISSLTSIYNISIPFLYLLPSLIIGYSFSFLIKYKIDYFFGINIISLLFFIIEYFTIYIFKIIFTIDVISYFLNIFSLNDFIYSSYLVIFFIYIYSLISTYFSFIFIKSNINKIDKDIKFYDYKNKVFIFLISEGILIILNIIFSLIDVIKPFSLLPFILSYIFIIYIVILDIKSDKYDSLISLIIIFLINLIFISFISIKYIFIIFSFTPFLFSLYIISKKYFINNKNLIK